MITMETLVMTTGRIDRDGVEHLIAQDSIRPAGAPGAWLFRKIDVARLRLIQDLRHTLAQQDEVLPVLLHLLDQLYAARRHLLQLRTAVKLTAPPDVHLAILNALSVVPRPVLGEGETRLAGYHQASRRGRGTVHADALRTRIAMSDQGSDTLPASL